ncbi:MAG: response regulator [Tepidamorphaceae bacterium]|nr:response regulator [Rhodobiaceae bacterium]MCC0048215.1 response regulator [Rhodobiaceae bacterium]
MTTILLVEDDPDDVFLIRKVIERAPIDAELVVVEHGQAALDHLDTFSSLHAEGVPVLILLDLNMPVMDGHEFIRILRQHPVFYPLPVVVLTTSSDAAVVRMAYKQGACAVITKVDSLEGMSEIVNSIADFWFHTAKPFNVK